MKQLRLALLFSLASAATQDTFVASTLSKQQLNGSLPLDSAKLNATRQLSSSWVPFTIVSGSGCEVDGLCLRSSRRRGEKYKINEGCEVQVAESVGPIDSRVFVTEANYDILTVNGQKYSGTTGPGSNVRPMGSITWTSDKSRAAKLGFEICVPMKPDLDSFSSGPTPAAAPTPAVVDERPTQTGTQQGWLVKDVMDGLGGAFEHDSQASARSIGLAACESVLGVGNCEEGACRCFQYFMRKGATSCNCDKAQGEYEFVFSNRDCSDVSQDYSGTSAGMGSLRGISHFVRRKNSGCSTDAWELVSPFGLQAASRHVVLDLRGAHYSAGDASWQGLQGTAMLDVDNVSYDPSEKAFMFGAAHAGDIVRADYANQLPDTWSFWAKIPSPGISGSAQWAVSAWTLNNGVRVNPRFVDLANSALNTTAEQWFHVVKVFSADMWETTYLNGELVLSEHVPKQALSSGSLLIGGKSNSLEESTSVSISDMAIFNRGLSVDEVRELNAVGRPSAPAVAPSSSWSVSAGPCRASGYCASSPFFPLLAEPDISCSVTSPAMPMKVLAMADKDTFTVDGVTYSGDRDAGTSRQHLHGVTPSGALAWTADNVSSSGWKICSNLNSTENATCRDDDAWRDRRFGDGLQSCKTLQSQQAWCWVRGFYSLAAQDACPYTCGRCGENSFEELSDSCAAGNLMDEAPGSDATACFRFCMASERCTHFGWMESGGCKRYAGCEAEPSADATLHTYVVPKKLNPPPAPFKQRMTWKGYVSMGGPDSTDCATHFSDLDTCVLGARSLELEVLDAQELGAGGDHCVYKLSEKKVIHGKSSCGNDERCLCLDRTASASVISQYTDVTTAQTQLVEQATEATMSVCSISNATKCEGKKRTLTRHKLELVLGPRLFPYIADWDGDGDKDLLIGRESGSLVYIEKTKGAWDYANAVGVPKTSRTGSCLQLWHSENEGTCNHWCCFASGFGDICFSGRGDWEACESSTAWGISASNALVAVPVDWDRDNDLDLLVSSCDGSLQYFRREADGTLTALPSSENPFIGILPSDGSKSCLYPEPVDWDLDGDLDLLVGRESGAVDYYENVDGVLSIIEGENSPLYSVSTDGLAAPCAVDWDGDGDIDLLVGNSAGQVLLYVRSAHGILVSDGDEMMKDVQVSSNSIPRALDYDDDGDMDLLVADGTTGSLYIWLSSTETLATERTERENPFDNLAVGRNAFPQAIDWDGNGLMDLLIGEHHGKVQYFQAAKDGTLRAAPAGNAFENLQVGTATIQQAIDWDADGDLDLIVGQEGGKVLFYEHLPTGQFGPGQEVLTGLGTFVAPHAVDWDNDGDLDLVVGDSGQVQKRSLRLQGFDQTEWNTWFYEHSSELSIGGREFYVTAARDWILAYCRESSYWFMFPNTSAALQENLGGTCSSAAAKLPTDDLFERGLRFGSWEVFGTYGLKPGTAPENVKLQTVASDGTERRPHCDTCNNRANPECRVCSITQAMHLTCAAELCMAQGFDTGIPQADDSSGGFIAAQFNPSTECACVDTDNGNLDIFGGPCSQYEDHWCGHYDTANFQSNTMCCKCGGGNREDGNGVVDWYIQAECFNKNVWIKNEQVSIAELLPPLDLTAPAGSVRFFERTGPDFDALTEHTGAANPFASVATGFRPRPYVVDFNRDGYLDLVLGGESPETEMLESNYSASKPLCGRPPTATGTCTFGDKERRICATGLCRAAGYTWGEWSDTNNPCLVTEQGAAGKFYINFETGSLEEMEDNSLVPATSIRVQCHMGGGILYWQQEKGGGALVENRGPSSPFATITAKLSASPQIVDWDGDDEWDIVVGDNSGKIRYFKQGDPCRHPEACNGMGLCHPVMGTCECTAGHLLSDCSRCARNYYSRKSSQAIIVTCLHCPGQDTDAGLCSSRGICFDDESARKLPSISNSTSGLAVGTGQCNCSEHFNGTNQLGLTDCTEGACPAGEELRLRSDGLTKECQPCQPGYAKGAWSNDDCSICPQGRFARDGATECSPCQGGKFQERAGQDTCELCLPEEYSPPGSASCSKCPVGRFSDQAQKSECDNCRPGHWSSAVGASQCSACPVGRSSDGTAECEACKPGSYAEDVGTPACLQCEPGRYSAVREATSSTDCQPCSIGRYSSSYGTDSVDTCLACDPGATTKDVAATNKSMCIQPDKQTVTCISGRMCDVRLTGSNLQAKHHIAITEEKAGVKSIQEPGISQSTGDGTSYSWSEAVSLGGGVYKLLWCPGIHSTCTTIEDMSFEVGDFNVVGPKKAQFTCVRGRLCQNLGPVAGKQLQSTDKLQVQGTCGTGPIVPITSSNADGYGMDITIDASGNMTFGFGTDSIGANPNRAYQICWCAMGRGVADGCKLTADFKAVAADFAVEGPDTGHELTCYLGQDCPLPGIEGWNLKAGDRLMVLGRCGEGQALQGMPGPDGLAGISEKPEGEDFEFLPLAPTGSPRTEKILQSFPGLYRICFCRPVQGGTCATPDDFRADTGFFTAKGPYRDQDHGCFVTGGCAIANMQGIGLENNDELVIIQKTDNACDDAFPEKIIPTSQLGIGVTRAFATNRGKDFALGGVSRNATPGTYQMCWRPSVSSKPYRAPVGLLHITCPAGTYRLRSSEGNRCEDCPIGFYCPGGSESSDNWGGDEKIRCDIGSTTRVRGAIVQDSCECGPGYVLGDNEACSQCPANSYKSSISNNATCISCPNGTISNPGSKGSDYCYTPVTGSEAQSQVNESVASVFVVSGAFKMPKCLSLTDKTQIYNSLKKSVADSLGVDSSDVILEEPPEDPSCNNNTAGRRLQTDANNIKYKVAQTNKADAQRLMQNLDSAVIAADVEENTQFTLTAVLEPFINTDILNCSKLYNDNSMAFEPGVQPTSLDDCSCAVGYQPNEDNGRCEKCDQGLFKDKIGNAPCTVCGSIMNEQVKLTTLTEGAIAETACTCPAGRFTPPGQSTPPTQCDECGMRFYCEGGSSRKECPRGSTTQDVQVKSVEQCVCEAGFRQVFRDLNETNRCQECASGKYKVSVGNRECDGECRANSESLPGAVGPEQCFCDAGYYFRNWSETCEKCPEDGMSCLGGFFPPGTLQHAEPVSKEGFYLTGIATAFPCEIRDEDGASVCLEGASYRNNSAGACSGLQVGTMCGACQALSARDLGDEACEACEESFMDWMHIGNLNFDLLLKSAFGIFLGKQAMDSATKTKKMEAVILRILLQWVTANSVLGAFDLSNVEIFEWSQKQLEDNRKANTIEAFTTATGLSFRFQWPEWFRPIWKTLTSITGSIPSPVSPQVSMECLVQRQFAEAGKLPSMAQLILPPLWWLIYPLFVVVWVAIWAVLIAKVFYPLLHWVAKRAKKRLSSRLTSMGVSSATANRTLNTMDPKRLKSILQDPVALTSQKGTAESFGGDVYAEVAAAHLVEQAGSEHMEMLQKIVDDPDSCTSQVTVSSAQRVLSGGVEFLGPFLIRAVKKLDRDRLPDLFGSPKEVPEAMGVLLREMEDAEASAILDRKSTVKSITRTAEEMEESDMAALGSIHELADLADEEEFDDEAIPDKDLSKEYVVFGLFRTTNLKDVLWDAFPLYIVTLYSIWDTVSRRMLALLQVRSLRVTTNVRADGFETASNQGLWLYDMRFEVGVNDHVGIAVIASLGIIVWSLTFVIFLFVKLRRNKHRLQEKYTIRNFGYFYNGLEPNIFWWELVVKKVDILILYIVTYTDVFTDPRAKLIMYLGQAGVFWALHNMYHPYDDRQNRLADRLEDIGLTVRFITLLLLQILLMVDADARTNAIVAMFLILANIWFLSMVAFLLVIEIPGTQVLDESSGRDSKAKEALEEKYTAKAADAFSIGDNPLLKAVNAVINVVVGKIVGPFVRLALRIAAIMARFKQAASLRVPHMQWQGVGLDLIVVTHEREKLRWYERFFALFVRQLYKLSDEEQKSFLARTISQFWDYVLNNSECHRLPSCIMDIFFVLPSAIKTEKQAENPDMSLGFHVRVAKRIRRVLTDRKSSIRQSGSRREIGRSTSFRSSTGLPAHTNAGEDFNSALLFMQRLSKTEVHDFLLEALVDSWPEEAMEEEEEEDQAQEEPVIGQVNSI